jgi:hypothetical protein
MPAGPATTPSPPAAPAGTPQRDLLITKRPPLRRWCGLALSSRPARTRRRRWCRAGRAAVPPLTPVSRSRAVPCRAVPHAAAGAGVALSCRTGRAALAPVSRSRAVPGRRAAGVAVPCRAGCAAAGAGLALSCRCRRGAAGVALSCRAVPRAAAGAGVALSCRTGRAPLAPVSPSRAVPCRGRPAAVGAGVALASRPAPPPPAAAHRVLTFARDRRGPCSSPPPFAGGDHRPHRTKPNRAHGWTKSRDGGVSRLAGSAA